jgi:hypothetical protein
MRPVMENTPSCASPGKPENSSAAKPHTEVSTPSRKIGHSPAAAPEAPPRSVPPKR